MAIECLERQVVSLDYAGAKLDRKSEKGREQSPGDGGHGLVQFVSEPMLNVRRSRNNQR